MKTVYLGFYPDMLSFGSKQRVWYYLTADVYPVSPRQNFVKLFSEGKLEDVTPRIPIKSEEMELVRAGDKSVWAVPRQVDTTKHRYLLRVTEVEGLVGVDVFDLCRLPDNALILPEGDPLEHMAADTES